MIKRKTIAWIGGLTTAAVTVGAFCVFTAADRRWDEWSRETDALQTRLDTVEVRPVLFGTATTGDAWEGYSAAIALTKADEALADQVLPSTLESLAPSQLTALLDAHAETLTQLHLGAHCGEVRNPIDWSKGFDGSIHSLLVVRTLSNLAVAQALTQIERGQQVAGVNTLLNAAQLGRDLIHSRLVINDVIGLAVMEIATCHAVGMNGLLDQLSPSALERFAAGLTILDENIAKVSTSMHGEAVMFARTARDHPQLFTNTDLSVGAWRYGFSARLMLADVGLRLMDFADRTAAAAQGPWSDCDTYLTDIEEELIENGDPALFVVQMSKGFLVQRFRTIARLRLLRMAIEHRLGRPVPQLADPFGDTLLHEVDTAGKARFWSIGSSGKIFLFPDRS